MAIPSKLIKISMIVFQLVIITSLLYYFEKLHFAYFELFRYLYFLPIIFSAWLIGLVGSLVVALLVISLYVPILLTNIEAEGLIWPNVELAMTLFLFLAGASILGKLIEIERKKKETYRILYQLSRITNSPSNIEKMLKKSLVKIADIFRVSQGAVFLTNRSELNFSVGFGLNNYQERIITASCENFDTNSIAAWILKNGQPLWSNNTEKDKRFLKPHGLPFNNADGPSASIGTNFLAVPLKSKDKITGILTLQNRPHPFSSDDVNLLSSIANHLNLALTNNRLALLASTDHLTGLLNNGYFQKRLKIEFIKAKRKNKPLSLILADIDHFKKINDDFGHQQGNIILKKIAKILLQNTPPKTIVSRYGGEEFVLVLPNTEKKEAIALANDLKDIIADQLFNLKGNLVNLTMSFGVSNFPEDSINVTDLIEKADLALYHAKNSGRNKVCTA
jgi:diguanylate cyclase (GGDEF)-like protein